MSKDIEQTYGKEIYRNANHVVRLKLDPAGNPQVRVHELTPLGEEQTPLGYMLGDNMLWFHYYRSK